MRLFFFIIEILGFVIIVEKVFLCWIKNVE